MSMQCDYATTQICVAYASETEQIEVFLSYAVNESVGAAIMRSDLLLRFPEIDLEHHKIGIYGKLTEVDAQVAAGDRIEIYRPLKVDPKEARRRRAEKSKQS